MCERSSLVEKRARQNITIIMNMFVINMYYNDYNHIPIHHNKWHQLDDLKSRENTSEAQELILTLSISWPLGSSTRWIWQPACQQMQNTNR